MSFNFMTAITIYSDFGAPKIKSDTVSTVSPSTSHEVMGPNGRKVMTNLDSIFKSRDITLPTEVPLVKAMVFSSSHVWM